MGVKAVIGDLTCPGTQWSDEEIDESLQEKSGCLLGKVIPVQNRADLRKGGRPRVMKVI